MPKYVVIKTLDLKFECEAGSPEQAKAKCAEQNDLEFEVRDCQYEVFEVTG